MNQIIISSSKKYELLRIQMEMLGIEPRTSYMQSMRSTTELHPLGVTHDMEV